MRYPRTISTLIAGGLALALTACSAGTDESEPASLVGSWSLLSTNHPELLGPMTMCYLFRSDSTYVLDEIWPAVKPGNSVPDGLRRWEGRIFVSADTLNRTLDRDRGWNGDSGVLIQLWDNTYSGSYSSAQYSQSRAGITFNYDTWVQGIGLEHVTDVFQRAPAGSCGTPVP